MIRKATFAGWDFVDIWARSDSINNGYPYLRWMLDEPIDDEEFYKISWSVNSVVVDSAEVLFGTTPSFTGDTPVRTSVGYDHTFTDWSPEITAVVGDRIYTAQFNRTPRHEVFTWNSSTLPNIATATGDTIIVMLAHNGVSANTSTRPNGTLAIPANKTVIVVSDILIMGSGTATFNIPATSKVIWNADISATAPLAINGTGEFEFVGGSVRGTGARAVNFNSSGKLSLTGGQISANSATGSAVGVSTASTNTNGVVLVNGTVLSAPNSANRVTLTGTNAIFIEKTGTGNTFDEFTSTGFTVTAGTFAYWRIVDGKHGIVYERNTNSGFIEVAGVTVTAGVQTATVTFNSTGGSAVEAQVINRGTRAVAPPVPTKADHTFMDWYSDEELTTLFDFSTALFADTTIYAKWYPVVTLTSLPYINEINSEEDISYWLLNRVSWNAANSGRLTFDGAGSFVELPILPAGATGMTLYIVVVGGVNVQTSPDGVTFTNRGSNSTPSLTIPNGTRFIRIVNTVSSSHLLYVEITGTIPNSSSSSSNPSSSSSEPSSSSSEPSSSSIVSSSSSDGLTPIILPQIATVNSAIAVKNTTNLQVQNSARIDIYSLNGKLEKTLNFKNGVYTVPLGYLPKGMYVVRVRFGSETKYMQVPVM